MALKHCLSEQSSLHGRFERQAKAHPHRVAISYESRQLTYLQLDELANQYAQLLLRRGVKSGQVVALLLPRGIEVVAQIIAVTKVGGCYLPIDTDYPRERILWLLEASQAAILISHREKYKSLFDTATAISPLPNVLLMDDPVTREALCSSGTAKPASLPSATATNSAYIIFTSGSTGKPKGVMVGHRQVCELLDAVIPQLQVDHSDVWSLFHSLAFDFSVWELWGALTTGAKLCLIPKDTAWSVEHFARLLRQEGVTILNQTPSAFYRLSHWELENNFPEKLPVKAVIFGGEALNLEEIKRWRSCYPFNTPRLINMYGITETTVHVTWLELTPDYLNLAGSPIGEPLTSLQLHLLNDSLKPVNDGVVGEMYVSGEQLAVGYLNRPDLTASRFVANPFDKGRRMYRSGDLAVRKNGHLFYLGRADRQLKIRGFRIDPSEIEATISRHPSIAQCVVIATPEQPGMIKTGLLAFLIAEQACSSPLLTTAELRLFLAQQLPPQCLPSDSLYIDTLPLTVNGKLDQATLLRQWQERLNSHVNQRRTELFKARLKAKKSKVAAPRLTSCTDRTN